MSDPAEEKDISEDILDDVTYTCNDIKSASNVTELQESNVINESEIKIDDLVKPSKHQTVLTRASNSTVSVRKDKEILENPNFDSIENEIVSREASKELVVSHECNETATLAVDDGEKEMEEQSKLSCKSKKNVEIEEIFDTQTKFEEEEITTKVNERSADSTNMKPLEKSITVLEVDAKGTKSSVDNLTDESSTEELTVSDNNVPKINMKPLEKLTSIPEVVNTDAKDTKSSTDNLADESSIEELTVPDNNVLKTNVKPLEKPTSIPEVVNTDAKDTKSSTDNLADKSSIEELTVSDNNVPKTNMKALKKSITVLEVDAKDTKSPTDNLADESSIDELTVSDKVLNTNMKPLEKPTSIPEVVNTNAKNKMSSTDNLADKSSIEKPTVSDKVLKANMKPLEKPTSIPEVVNIDAKDPKSSTDKLTDESSIEELIISDDNVLKTDIEVSDEKICCEECDQIFKTSATPEEFKCESELFASNEISEKISGSSDDVETVIECEFLEESTRDKNEVTLNDEVLETPVFCYEKISPILQENLKISKESSIDEITLDEPMEENKNSKLSSPDISHEINNENNSEVFAPHKSEVSPKDELFVNLDECTENNSALNIYNLENRSISIDKNNDEPLPESFIKETIIDSGKQIIESSSSMEEREMHLEPVTSIKEDLNICNELLKSNHSNSSICDIKDKELIDTSTRINNPDTEELIVKSSFFVDDNSNPIYSCHYKFSDRIICECFIGKLEDFSSHSTPRIKNITETGELSENVINDSIQTATEKRDSLLLSSKKESLSSKTDGIASNLNLESDEEIPIKETLSDVLAEKLFQSIKEHLNLSDVKIWNTVAKSFYRNVSI